MVVIKTISSPFPSPSRFGTSYSITRMCQVLSGSRSSPGPGGLDQRGPRLASDLRIDQYGPVGAVGQQLQYRQPQVRFYPPQQRRPGIRRLAPVRQSYRSSGRRSAASPPRIFTNEHVAFPGRLRLCTQAEYVAVAHMAESICQVFNCDYG
jgi:hypothetical protein